MRQHSTTFPPAAVEALRRTVAGAIVYPSDPSYPALLRSRGVAPTASPGVVVVPDTEEAVGAAVDVARTYGLTVASDVGRSAPDASMLVLTRQLDDLVVDVDAATATVMSGASWARLAAALDGSGLGPTRAGEPDAAVVDSVVGGRAAALWARVVRSDGFIHVVVDAVPPVDDPGPWVVTAVVVPLTHTPSPVTHPIPNRDQEVPS